MVWVGQGNRRHQIWTLYGPRPNPRPRLHQIDSLISRYSLAGQRCARLLLLALARSLAYGGGGAAGGQERGFVWSFAFGLPMRKISGLIIASKYLIRGTSEEEE